MKWFSSLLFGVLLLQGCADLQKKTTEQPPAAGGRTREAAPQLKFALLQPSNIEAEIVKWTMHRPGADALVLQRSEVGYYLDVQEAQLQSRLHGSGTSLLRDGDTILVRITDAFDTNSSRLGPELRSTLDSISAVLREFSKTLVVVNSHTDSTGSPEFNRRLSEQRAIAVARDLTSKGVAPERIAAVGFGESSPLGPADARNRRIDIRLLVIVGDESADQ